MLGSPNREPERRKSPVMGHASSGVVTATGSMSWPGWVGAMNWFMMTSTWASFHVGQAGPAQDQGGRVGRQFHRRRLRRYRRRRGRHHQGCDADRHRHPRGSSPNRPYSQRDRQCADATDVLCGTHHRSSIDVVAERWPPRRGRVPRGESSLRMRWDERSSAPLQSDALSSRQYLASVVSYRLPEPKRVCNPRCAVGDGTEQAIKGGRLEPGVGLAMRRAPRGSWFRSSSSPGNRGFRRCERKASAARQLHGWTIPEPSALLISASRSVSGNVSLACRSAGVAGNPRSPLGTLPS